jgi:hypothetical protein
MVFDEGEALVFLVDRLADASEHRGVPLLGRW